MTSGSSSRREAVRPDADVHLALELVIAPFYFRSLITRWPLDEDFRQRLVDAILQLLCSNPRVAGPPNPGGYAAQAVTSAPRA